MAVRCLAIENYYGLNEFGFELYKKMHTVGGNYGQINKAEDYYKQSRKRNKNIKIGLIREDHSVEQFKKLIESFDESGYDPASVIMCDMNLLNINGSHRIALAYYRGQEFITSEIQRYIFPGRRLKLDWFWENGFSDREILQIRSKQEEIIHTCKERTGNYYCLLYPAGEKYFDEIQRDIGLYDPENIQLIGTQDFELELADFVGSIKFIYKFDSILPHNLERKISYILRAAEIKPGSKVKFRVIAINIGNPLYRLKKDNGLSESIAMVRMKQSLRERYKVKEERFTKQFKNDYAHDVLIHSTDNYISNVAFRYWMSFSRDLTRLFKRLEKKDYVIVENGIEKIPNNFPTWFYLNEDIDIFTSKKDLHEISSLILEFCKNHFVHPWINIYSEKTDNGERIWVKLRESMIVMFDLMTSFPEINEKFIGSCLKNRIGDCFYHLPLKQELVVRLAKYISNNTKEYHADYIRNNISCFAFDENNFTDSKKAKHYLQSLLNQDGAAEKNNN